MTLRRTSSIVVLALALVGFTLSPAYADHYRAAVSGLTYANGTLTWTVDAAWRKDDVDRFPATSSDVVVTNSSQAVQSVPVSLTPSVPDQSNPLYAASRRVATININSLLNVPGSYQVYATYCCRIGDVQNTDLNTAFSQAVTFTIQPDQSVTLPPVVDHATLYALLQRSSTGTAANFDFGAASPLGLPVTYSLVTNTDTPDFGAAALPCSQLAVSILTISPSLCLGGSAVYDAVYHPGYYFAVKVRATDSAGNYAEVDTQLRVVTWPTPRIGSRTVVGSSAEVAVSAGDDTAADSYRVTCINNADPGDVQVGTATTSPVHIAFLHPSSSYDCTATAYNSVGAGSDLTHYPLSTGVFASQSTTFTPLVNTPLAAGTVAMSAAASSGLPVTYSSATPAFCGVIGSVLTLLQPGTCAVNADQHGDATHGAAPTATQSFTVLPAAPTATARTTTGVGTATQSLTLTIPAGGSVTLLDGANHAVSQLAVLGEGTYVLNLDTGTVIFQPASGFAGTCTPIAYRVTDSYAQSAIATYSPTVTRPAPPSPAALTSTGGLGLPQQNQIVIPTSGGVALRGTDGTPVSTITVPGQGKYSLDQVTGVITFTPLPSFLGRASAASYLVTDAYGQSAIGTYSATVTGHPVPTPVTSHPVPTPVSPGVPSVSAARSTVSATVLSSTCSLKTGILSSCTITAYAMLNACRVKVGSGAVSLPRSGRVRGARAIRARVVLNTFGRALVNQPGSSTLSLVAAMHQVAVPGLRYASTRTHVVAPIVQLRPIYFGFNSAAVASADRRYLKVVSARLGAPHMITCAGHTDYAGTSSHEQQLSRQRAANVCALLRAGHPAVRFAIIAHAGTRPFSTIGTPQTRTINRRAEIRLQY